MPAPAIGEPIEERHQTAVEALLCARCLLNGIAGQATGVGRAGLLPA